MATNIFERATKAKLRFDSPRGRLTVEDLWDLPLTGAVSLDNIYKAVNRQVKEAQEESIVNPTTASTKLNLQLDIIKHIVEVKMEERDKAKEAIENKEKKQRILAALADKEEESLKGKSPEELKAMLKDL